MSYTIMILAIGFCVCAGLFILARIETEREKQWTWYEGPLLSKLRKLLKLVIKPDSKDKVAMVNVQCPVCGRTIDITEETYEVPEQDVCEDCFLRLTLRKRNK